MNLLGGTREKRVLEEQEDEEMKDKEENEREGINKDYFLKEDREGGKGEGRDVTKRAVRRAM